MGKENRPDSVFAWMGLRSPRDFCRPIWLGPIVGSLLIALFAIVSVALLANFLFAVTGLDGFTSPAERHEAIRNTGLAVAALIGVPFLIWRSIVAQKQADTAEHGLMAERITKAIDQLGSDSIAVRTGAIYALESIMVDSEANRVRMWKIVNAYLNEEQRELRRNKKANNPPELREDIQAALSVLSQAED